MTEDSNLFIKPPYIMPTKKEYDEIMKSLDEEIKEFDARLKKLESVVKVDE